MEGQVSRALPPPGTINEILYAERERTDDKLLMSKEARYQSQSDRVHENSTEKEDFSSNTSRSRKRISQSWHRRSSNSNALRENHISRYEIDTVKKDFPIENAMVSLTPTSTITTGARTTFECLTTSSASSDICYPDFSRIMLERNESSRGAQEHSNLKEKLKKIKKWQNKENKRARKGKREAKGPKRNKGKDLGAWCKSGSFMKKEYNVWPRLLHHTP